MNTIRRIIAAHLLVILLHTVGLACSCINIPSVEEAIESSDLIVKAKVLSYDIIEYFGNGREVIIPKDEVRFRLTTRYSSGSEEERGTIVAQCRVLVQQVFEGSINHDTITIITGLGRGDCGYIFDPRKKYLIYGSIQDNEYKPRGVDIFTTTICTRTKKYKRSESRKLKQLLG
jgi:hypothetical protein